MGHNYRLWRSSKTLRRAISPQYFWRAPGGHEDNMLGMGWFVTVDKRLNRLGSGGTAINLSFV